MGRLRVRTSTDLGTSPGVVMHDNFRRSDFDRTAGFFFKSFTLLDLDAR
jgi:hypothetical protein